MYMAQVRFAHTPLSAAISRPIEALQEHCDLEPSAETSLWLGPSGHTEPLHYDVGHGTLMQLHGAKRVILFPPTEAANLYPFPQGGPIPPHFSRIDTDRPDFSTFPRYREALTRRVELILNHGEVLFIPSKWWHEVTALGGDYVCSVNRFWKSKVAS